MNSAFNENQPELGVLVLSVSLQVSAHINSLLDQEVEVLGDLGSNALHLEHTEHLSTRHGLHGGYPLCIPEQDSDLGGRLALLGQLDNLLLHRLGIGLVPGGGHAGVGAC